MKASLQLALWLAAALLGAALGFISRPEPSLASPLRAEAERATAGAASPTSEAVSAVLSALLRGNDFRTLAHLGEVLPQLDDSQMRELLDKVDTWPAAERKTWLPRLLADWTRRSPDAAAAWLEPRLAAYAKDPAFGGMANFESDLVLAWVRNAPERAMNFARARLGTPLARILLHNAIFDWPEKDDARRFEVLRSFPAGPERASVMNSFFNSWAQIGGDRGAALAAAAGLPEGPERNGALREVLAQWARQEPAVALEKAQSFGLRDSATLMILANALAKKDPAAAIRAVEKMDPALLPAVGSVVVQAWAEKDLAGALNWAIAHGVSLTTSPPKHGSEDVSFIWRHELTTWGNPLSELMTKQLDGVVAWGLALPPGPNRERYLEHILHLAPDPAAVAPYISELPPDAAASAVQTIAGRMAAKDFDQALAWAKSLPAGALRSAAWSGVGWMMRHDPLDVPGGPDGDAMLAGSALARRRQDPVAALEDVLQIRDLALRRQIFDDILWDYNRPPLDPMAPQRNLRKPTADPRSVAKWLQTAPIPADWKRPISQ